MISRWLIPKWWREMSPFAEAMSTRDAQLRRALRVIRLEERLRMERVLPEDLRERIPEFSTDQLIGLRFAPNEGLEDLARRVLSG